MAILKPEEQLQILCADYLRKAYPRLLWWSSGNGMYMGRSAGKFGYIAKQKRMGLLVGVPDLQMVWLDERGIQLGFIELKAGYNKPTKEQAEFIARAKSLGCHAGWTNTFEGFLELLKNFGVK
jgi:hypothetical protein